jgi:mono/diheme cytochrome c family protein
MDIHETGLALTPGCARFFAALSKTRPQTKYHGRGGVRMSRSLLVLAAIILAAAPALAQDNAERANSPVLTATTIWAGIYTDGQAAQGRKFYAAACSECHGEQLEGDLDQGFPALASPGFMIEWDGQTMADLVRHIHTSPHDNPSDMDRDTAVALAAFILNRNGAPSGKAPLSPDAKEEAKIMFTKDKPK